MPRAITSRAAGPMGILSEILGVVGKRRQTARATEARVDLKGNHGTEIGEPTSEGPVGEQMHDLLTQQQEPVQQAVELENEVPAVSQIETEDETGELPPAHEPAAKPSHDLLRQQQEPVQQPVELESEVPAVSQIETEDETGELPPAHEPATKPSTPSPDINDPQPWRERAEQARAEAENMTSVFKKTMLTVAAHYELLAKRAERQSDTKGRRSCDANVRPGLTRDDVEQLARNYSQRIEKVRAIAHERYPDDDHEAARLSQRAVQNVRTALIAELKESGCPPEEVQGWLTAILQAAERPSGQTDI